MDKRLLEGPGYYFEGQIDKINRRLKVFKYTCENYLAMTEAIRVLTVEEELSKVWLRAREKDWISFFRQGFQLEAMDPHFFQGAPAYHLAYYPEAKRRYSSPWQDEQTGLAVVLNKDVVNHNGKLPEVFSSRIATYDDIPEMIELFKIVFVSYPTPLTDYDYLKKAMEEDTFFLLIKKGTELVACASAEIDSENRNAEITDCATNPDWHGHGLMTHIVRELEDQMIKKGLYSLYTIARSMSPGINHVFKKLGYDYGGRFINNCHICGQFEDMNLWTKKVQ